MKRSSARGLGPRTRRPLFAMLALATALGMAGCENDGGAAGPDGPAGGGDPGQTGPTGPTGPADVPILEGGDVTGVGSGSALTAQQIADIGTLVATLDSATVSGNKPVIELTVTTDKGGKVLGLAATTLRLGVAKLVPATGGMPSRWQSYINRSAAPSVATPTLPSAIQATTESGVAAGWTELGAGRYRYAATTDLAAVTTPIAVTYEPTLTHRISIAVELAGNARALAPDNPFLDFVPAGGTPASKLIAATDKCQACHVRFAEHGGPRRDVEYCVVCHNPATIDPDAGESVDLGYMAHSIHRGEARSNAYVVYGFGGTQFDFHDVTYPQPASFCETCHAQSTAAPQGDDWMSNATAAACGGCHDAGLAKTGPSPTTGQYSYTYTHSEAVMLPPSYVAADGTCTGCHGPARTAGDNLVVHQRDLDRQRIEQGGLFTYEILSIADAAVGQAPKVTFRLLDADGAPLDVKALTAANGSLRLDFAWSTPDVHNVADVAGNAYQTSRGQALVVDLIANTASVVANGDGTFSYTLSQPLPAGFADATLGTGLMVVLEGRRLMPDGSRAYPESAVAYSGTPRETLVDQAKCESCHFRLAAHGGNRVGSPQVCLVCHNSSVGGQWVVGGVTEDFGSVALGPMLHSLHSSNLAPFGPVTYPQELARCEGCHVPGRYGTARASALPLTVDAGTSATADAAALAWQDDLADSATAGTCKGCHTTAEAQSHMLSQGGAFAVPKTLTPSAAVEGCATCHGAGRTFDTAVLHCSTLPFGQCTR